MLKQSALILTLAATLAGCATPTTYETGTPIEDSAVQSLTIDQTTRTQLVSLFGQPTTSTIDHEGNEMLSFTHSIAVSEFAGPMDIKVTQLVVQLNADGTIKSYQHIRGDQPTTTITK